MNEQPLVCEEVRPVDLRRLASAVVIQDLRECQKGTVEQRADAILWLCSPDAAYWLDVAGVFPNVYDLLAHGRYRKVKLVLRGNRR